MRNGSYAAQRVFRECDFNVGQVVKTLDGDETARIVRIVKQGAFHLLVEWQDRKGMSWLTEGQVYDAEYVVNQQRRVRI